MVAAGLLDRIRLFRPAPAPAPGLEVADGPELGEDDLEMVVGGLERVFVPGGAAPAGEF